MTIATLPPAPSRADAANADTFSEIAETFVAALPVFSTQVNNTLTDVNAAASGALASSNFKGSWAALTGAMSIPASVLHADTLWLLVTNTSDITADEPGVSAKWLDLAAVSGYVALVGDQTIAGNKTFTGNVSVDDLSATTGTFSGNVSSSGGVFTGDGSGLTDVVASSADTASKLNTASGAAPSFSARAWVNFNGQSPVVIRASGNIAGVVRNAVGDYTVNFLTAMPSANYALISGGVYSDGVDSYGLLAGDPLSAQTTTSARFITVDATGAATDFNKVSLAVFV